MARNTAVQAILVAVAFAIGWWAHGARPVEPVQAAGVTAYFQLQGLSQGSALTLYYPDERAIYVYPAATTGFSTINCSYKFRLGAPGAPIEREQCPLPRMR